MWAMVHKSTDMDSIVRLSVGRAHSPGKKCQSPPAGASETTDISPREAFLRPELCCLDSHVYICFMYVQCMCVPGGMCAQSSQPDGVLSLFKE